MTNTATNILMFTSGLALGGVVGALAVKKYFAEKYAKIANQEIEEARSAYNQRLSNMNRANCNKPDASELVKAIQADPAEGKSPFAESTFKLVTESEDPDDPVIMEEGPVLQEIGDDEWIRPNGYDKVNVLVFKDGVVAYERDYEVVDIDETVGIDAVQRVARHVDEAVHIRNETLMTEYEVTYENHTYTEATGIIYRE